MTLTNIQPVARLILSLGVIFGVLAAVAATSSALFSDGASITGSTFSTGSASLTVADRSAGDGNVPGTFVETFVGPTMTGLFPDGPEKTFKFWLKNESASPIDLDLSAKLDPVLLAGDLGQFLMVGFNCVIPDSGGSTSTSSLNDWDNPDTFRSGLGILNPGEIATCTMAVNLHEDSVSPNTTASFDVNFLGVQVAAP